MFAKTNGPGVLSETFKSSIVNMSVKEGDNELCPQTVSSGLDALGHPTRILVSFPEQCRSLTDSYLPDDS